jgi:hypothetical protein
MASNFQHITIEDDRRVLARSRCPGRARVVRAALRVEAGHLPPGTRARLVDAVLDCRRPTWHTTRGDSPRRRLERWNIGEPSTMTQPAVSGRTGYLATLRLAFRSGRSSLISFSGLTGQLLVQPLWFMACPSPLTSSCLMAGGRDHGLRCADPCGALLRERH